MAMGIGPVVSSAGNGTGAISRGAFGDDAAAGTANASAVMTGAATAALGAIFRAATGAVGLGAGGIADAAVAVAVYARPDCGLGTPVAAAGRGLAAAGSGAAGLRSLAWISNRRAASRVREYPAA